MAEVFEEKSRIILEKASEKRNLESGDQTKERLVNTLKPRDEALRKIMNYQDKTGIPSEDETDGFFLKNEAKVNLQLDEFRLKENEAE